MTRPLRIANCSGFFGDHLSAAREMVEGGPIGVLTSGWLDALALLRPPFAMDRLRKEGAALFYRCAKQHSEPAGDKRGAKVGELSLTPLALIDRIAALVPPPRTHRHRYFGVLAPNSPRRASVTAVAQAVPAQIESVQVESATTSAGEGAQIKKILDHTGVDSQAPCISLAYPSHIPGTRATAVGWV